MPSLDPGLLALALISVGSAVLVVWLTSRRSRGGRTRGGGIHAMARDDSIGYFRDYGPGSSEPGVQEEDSPARWGDKD